MSSPSRQRKRANAARVFNLARQDVAGFDQYAQKIAALFTPGAPVLVDVLEGLFEVACADGNFHPAEEAFLSEVARIFWVGRALFQLLARADRGGCAARSVSGAGCSHLTRPWRRSRRPYRAAVRENHPDRLAARGIPAEAVQLAEHRLRDINRAWDDIQAARAA